MMRVACLYLESPVPQAETLRALAEACFRFTPQIALGERGIFLEIGASHRLFSEQFLTMRLGSLAKRFGFLARVTFGNSAGEAFALARYPSFLYAKDLPLDALADYAFPFAPDPDAAKELGELIRTLKVLGLKSIGDLAALPPRALASRFGKEAARIGSRMRGEWPEHGGAWPGFHPTPQVVEKAAVENSDSLEAILFVLRGLADRMVARLRGRGERVSVLNIRFDLVKWGGRRPELGGSGKVFKREFKLSLPLAQGSVNGLIPILRDYLSRRLESEPFDAPVDSVQLEVLETVPSRSAQRDFFSKKEEEAEIWDALVARLSQKLGKQRVFTAVPERRYLPEKAFSRTLKRESRESPPWPARPTRLLAHPRVLGPLGSVRAVSLEGPERLSGEWWDSQYEGFNRDYYRLKTVSGEELWVFVNRNAAKGAPKNTTANAEKEVLYLHGYFD